MGFVRFHLRIATINAGAWSLLEALLVLALLVTRSEWAAFCLVIVILMQWFVFPWLILRYLFDDRSGTQFPREDDSQGGESCDKPALLVTKEKDGVIPDLGYLIRDATFSVDTTRHPEEDGRHDSSSTTPPDPADFYDRIEQSLSDGESGHIHARRVALKGSEEVQPGAVATSHRCGPRVELDDELLAKEHHRLLVVAQHASTDGLASVELNIRPIGPHLSLHLRLRWLPPLRKWFQRLPLLAMERTWWRGFTVPVIIGIVLVLQWFVVGAIMARERGLRALEMRPHDILFGGGELPAETTPPGADHQLGAITPASVDAAESLAMAVHDEPPHPGSDEASDPLRKIIGQGLTFLSAATSYAGGAMAPFTLFALLCHVIPLLLLAMVLCGRGLRYLRGLFHAATGTYLDVSSPCCYAFRGSSVLIQDDASLHWGLSYLHVMEEVVINGIIATLKERNIDTTSIRDEVRVFVNEGIYMTGGRIHSEVLAVGRSARASREWRRRVLRSGRSSLIGRSEGRAQ